VTQAFALGDIVAETVDVLVVDDHDDVRESTAEILRSEGYIVEQARHGDEALVVMKLCQVRAVVVDLRLPGIETMSTVAQMADPPTVILISAYPFGHEALRVFKDVFMQARKPVSPRRLVEMVGLALEQRWMKRRL